MVPTYSHIRNYFGGPECSHVEVHQRELATLRARSARLTELEEERVGLIQELERLRDALKAARMHLHDD